MKSRPRKTWAIPSRSDGRHPKLNGFVMPRYRHLYYNQIVYAAIVPTSRVHVTARGNLMPHKKALRRICSPCARWKLTAIVNAMVILEAVEEAVALLLRPLSRRHWREIADTIEMLPLSIRVGVSHGI